MLKPSKMNDSVITSAMARTTLMIKEIWKASMV